MHHTISVETIFIYAIFVFALVLLGDSFYIKTKAQYAQYLIGNSWQYYANTGEIQKPWPWADTFPIAELSIQDTSHFILSGASGRNLAFGPAHLANTASLGSEGNAAIAGHRDTHFEQLKTSKLGDLIYLTSRQEDKLVKQVFRVSDIKIVDEKNIDVLQETSTSTLTLITCYPFDSIDPNPSQRYIVKAELI
ncbi:class GN sortase [Glaciecola sp. MH2013]|nr:class GN sortase [Glaciecola sp. MH2013]